MKIISTSKLDIKSWCSNLETSALKQAVNVAEHPMAVGHVALMPDCHLGYGVPIGCVLATKDAIIPNAVGVDIGCGMIALKTNLHDIYPEAIKNIFSKLKKLIPVGFNRHVKDIEWHGFNDNALNTGGLIRKEIPSAKKQLGTLGGGNHFIEIQKSNNGNIWLMIHSGSRNLGYKVANYYHNKALEFCTLHNIELPDDNLAFLLTDSELGKEYIAAMRYCQWFATENRQTMLNKFYSIVEDITCCDFIGTQIDVPHNYAIEEHIESEKDLVWIHRKGAIRVDPLSKGIIPGSMGTNSYIIAGKENKDSFNSSSHGAGRNMGRSEFNKTHTVDECDQAMKGIVFGRWGKNRKGKVDLSEAPQAYKNIKDVMKDQEDLVDILVALTPLGCMKG